jgi:hypothetical protein
LSETAVVAQQLDITNVWLRHYFHI